MMEEDEVSTQLITKLNWLQPVERVEDLPVEGVPDGSMCFVEADGEEEVWQFVDGVWVRVDML